MTRRLMMVGVLAGLMVAATSVSVAAHDNYRIIGTITKVTAKTLAVTQTDRKTVSMRMDEATLVTRDKKTVGAAELRNGLSVVIDASGDSLEDLVVLEIRIVPSPTKK